jgi:hypothetical protein
MAHLLLRPSIVLAGLAVVAAPAPFAARQTAAPAMASEYQAVLQSVGRAGDYKDNVLKVNIPRNDLAVTVEGVATPTPFGFGGWFAMTKGTGGMEVMMGDLVLTEDEVNPVMSSLLDNGLEVTALHNHFFFDAPRMFFMHVHGHGSAAELASKIKPAVDLIGKTPPRTGSVLPGRAIQGSLDTAALATIIGTPGEQNGAVYKITIGRPDVTVREMGAVINSRMGLNTWAAFYGNDADAVVAGDVAMLDTEVTPVLKALRSNNIAVVAIHQHMIGTQPNITFLHYWGKGQAQQLARGVKAAVDQLGKGGRR